jgi:PKD repeat protein
VEIASGDEVEFTDTSTFEAGCPILTRSWDFDDGGTILDADTPTVTTDVFTDSGPGHTDYTVRLTVTNAGGTDSDQVTVRADGP